MSPHVSDPSNPDPGEFDQGPTNAPWLPNSPDTPKNRSQKKSWQSGPVNYARFEWFPHQIIPIPPNSGLRRTLLVEYGLDSLRDPS
jgi:hypothetical protein